MGEPCCCCCSSETLPPPCCSPCPPCCPPSYPPCCPPCYPPCCPPVCPPCYPPCCQPCCPPPPPQPQTLVMRPGCPDNSNPFIVKMTGQSENNVCVVPPACTTKDGTKITEISDPGKEMFVLRIGKKSQGYSKKNNVDLELCTPRPVYIPPPPVLDTKMSQYDPADFGGKAEGGEKGKKGEDEKKEKGGGKKEKEDKKEKGGGKKKKK